MIAVHFWDVYIQGIAYSMQNSKKPTVNNPKKKTDLLGLCDFL